MLLTNDLTPDVVEEAIAYKVTIIVAYRELSVLLVVNSDLS